MLDQFDQAERTLKADVDKLEASAPGIDSNNLYQRLDLSTIDGIDTARKRTAAFATQMEDFANILEKDWAKVKAIIDNSDLNEPLQSQLKAKLALDETDRYPKYRAWTAAAHDDVEAVDRYLDVNEHYLGQFKWSDNTLSFTNPKVPGDVAKAQAALNLTEDNYKQAASAALNNRGNTVQFVLATLHEMEKNMTPRKNAVDQRASESNH